MSDLYALGGMVHARVTQPVLKCDTTFIRLYYIFRVEGPHNFIFWETTPIKMTIVACKHVLAMPLYYFSDCYLALSREIWALIRAFSTHLTLRATMPRQMAGYVRNTRESWPALPKFEARFGIYV